MIRYLQKLKRIPIKKAPEFNLRVLDICKGLKNPKIKFIWFSYLD